MKKELKHDLNEVVTLSKIRNVLKPYLKEGEYPIPVYDVVLEQLNDITMKLKEEAAKKQGEYKAKYFTCASCKYKEKKVDEHVSTEFKTRVETVWTDAGYGDDDRLANVERKYTYYVCPKCGWKSQLDMKYVRKIGEEWTRR